MARNGFTTWRVVANRFPDAAQDRLPLTVW